MTANNNQRVPFPLGRVLSTPGALCALGTVEILVALSRHAHGDWGDVCDGDRGRNELALRDGSRLFSVYRAQSGEKFWIITEADRSATTVLLPHEY